MSELTKWQKAMDANKTTMKLIQYCKTRSNSVYDMFQRVVELHRPMTLTAVLSDRNIVKLAVNR